MANINNRLEKLCFINSVIKLKDLSVFISLLAPLIYIFYTYPQIDLYVSSLFYDKDVNSFIYAMDSVIADLNKLVKYVFKFLIIVMGILFSYLFLNRKRNEQFNNYYKSIIYVLLVATLGFIVIHCTTKDIFHRARPYTITEFGGTKTFTKVGVISDQCDAYCSFPSDHAAFGFMLYAFVFLFKKNNNRLKIMLLATTIGCAVGFLRIAIGKHFLTDIVFSGIIIFSISWIIHALFFRTIFLDKYLKI